MRKNRCRLCGGKLDKNYICTECGMNNKPDSVRHGKTRPGTDHIPDYSDNRRSRPKLNAGYIVLAVFIIAFSTLTSGIISTISTPARTPEYKHVYTLEPGLHHIGSDIPAGKYHIQVEKGENSSMGIFAFEDDTFYQIALYVFSESDKDQRNSYILNNNYYLLVPPGSELGFYSNEVSTAVTLHAKNSQTTSYTLTRTTDHNAYMYFMAGQDFPVGIYDIVYPAHCDKDITVECKVPYPGTDELMMHFTLTFKASDEEQVFTGIPMTEGTKIYLDHSDARVTLNPTEYTNSKFYEMTLGFKK